MIAVFFDIRNRERNNIDRMHYDTPFWDEGGKFPGFVCVDDVCYHRYEVNYFAQGMWAAANGENMKIAEFTDVQIWKTVNYEIHLRQAPYPNDEVSEATKYWFEVGYNVYMILNQHYDELIKFYPPQH